jgi:squalene-hopene/tetraprenyl-beta-curcumene cyclase
MSRWSLARREFLAASAALAAAGSLPRLGLAADAVGPDPKQYEALVSKAIDFLRTKGQADDGSFTRQIGIGVTALAATALLRHGRTPDDPTVAKALKAIEAAIQPTGGIHAPNGRLKTYETCVAVVCLSLANKDGRYDKALKDADKFIKGVPFDAQEGHEKDSFFFGGAGYGGQGRPDLSNTSFMIDALKSTGNGAEDQAIRNALIFVSRCQNLESPHNTTPFAAKLNDGGFYYTPVPGDEEKEDAATGGLRSYGAMSYAGLKSMVFAGVSKDDPRVKAVIKWIGKHYDLKTHPGQGEAGLFYYYATFAKALAALGEDFITDDAGAKHDWRKDLAAELARRQRDDGSWVNANAKFMEGDANLCTSFALLALADAAPKK